MKLYVALILMCIVAFLSGYAVFSGVAHPRSTEFSRALEKTDNFCKRTDRTVACVFISEPHELSCVCISP